MKKHLWKQGLQSYKHSDFHSYAAVSVRFFLSAARYLLNTFSILTPNHPCYILVIIKIYYLYKMMVVDQLLEITRSTVCCATDKIKANSPQQQPLQQKVVYLKFR